jgi:hypothetical protein
MQESSQLASCMYSFFKLNLLFCGFLISYVCIINASFYMIKIYEIHKICLKFKLKIKFRYFLDILVIYTYILLKIKIS